VRRPLTTRAAAPFGAIAVLALLAGAAPASAASDASFAPPIAGLLDDIASTVLGGLDWSVDVAGDFILNLLGGLVSDLIPRSWIRQGVQIMGWLVAVPDYTGRVAGPGGGRHYGFAGVNAMRELYTWLGMAIAPLTLVYATSRSWTGQGDPPHVPLTRVLIVAVALLNYTWLWSQAVALTNQITHAILGVPAVTNGIETMFEVLIAGAALGGLPLIGLLLMGAGGLQLIALIFVKVVLILVGAVAFAIGPLMIGLVATERGNALARAWMTMTLGLFVLPIVWGSIFAIAAVLINDASSGSAVLGSGAGLGRLLGGLLIALAAIAGFWMAIKLTKAFGSLVGGQLAGLLALAGGGARALLGGAGRGASSAAGAASGAAGAAGSLRGFASKVGGAVSGAAGALVPAGRAGAVLAGAGAGAGTLARGGLIGAGGALASKAIAGAAASGAARGAASSRAGSVATRAARGAQRGFNNAPLPPAVARARSSTPGPTSSAPPNAPAAPASFGVAPATTGQTPASTSSPSAPSAASSRPSRPRGRVRTPTSSPSSPARRDAPPVGSSSSADPANEAARNAFGQPRALKPTRSVRHPFKRGGGR